MKNRKKYIILILLAAITGFIASFLKHNFYLSKLLVSIKSIHWSIYLPIILLLFIFIILIHELGHLIYFVIKGIKIKALYLFIFTVIKKDDRWRFIINFKNAKLIGGFVVPIIPEITTEEQYEKVKKTFAQALLAGPITSIAYFVISFIFFILLWFYSTKNILIGLLLLNFIVTLPLTIIIHASSKLNIDNMYGDYKAFEMFKEERFSLLQIIQYYSFTNKENENVDKFYYNKLINYFENNSAGYHLFDITLLSYLILHIFKLKEEKNETVIKTIEYYNLRQLARSKHGYELTYLISSYYYYIDNVEKSYSIFQMIQTINNKHIDSDKKTLLKLEYEHFLNINDNKAEIYQMKDVVIKEYDMLATMFNVEEDLKELTKKLDFKQYKTDIITYL